MYDYELMSYQELIGNLIETNISLDLAKRFNDTPRFQELKDQQQRINYYLSKLNN